MLRRALTGGAIAAFVACSLPTSDEFAKSTPPLSHDGGSVVDGSPSLVEGGASQPDAGPPIEAGVDAALPIIDLLQQPDTDFENGKCGLDSGGFQSTLTPSTVAHTGNDACLLCRAGTGDGNAYTLDTQLRSIDGVGVLPGQQYMAQAWVRRPPGATDMAGIRLSLRTHDGDFNAIDEGDSDTQKLTDNYALLSTVVNVTVATTDMDVFVGSMPPASDGSACFLIDDVLVWRSK